MSRIMPHGKQQRHCQFALGCAASILGISYDTLYKRYHRGAVKATKYGGILFITYPELKRLEKQKQEEDENEEINKRISSDMYQLYYNKKREN